MTSYNSSSTSASYTYRADGMRTKKVVGSTATRFAYDGQMPVETWDGTTITRQALGARGIDWTQATTSSGSSVSYPIYDAHGNNVASLSKSGSSYSLSGRRSYGAWGEIRQGATSGGSTSRYCASIGHLDDDESALTFMRARYYEPGSGRFVSSDTAKNGINWYVYCSNIQTSKIDPTGKEDIVESFTFGLLLGFMGNVTQSLLYGQGWQAFSAIQNCAMGVVAVLAAKYISNFIKEKLPKVPTIARATASFGGAIGAAVAGFYGAQAGKILFELFMQDLENYAEIHKNDPPVFQEGW